MNMVASMSIIKGKGGVRSIMDNVIKNETERQEMAHATELAELKERYEKELNELKEKYKRQSMRVAKLKRQRDILFKYTEPKPKKGIVYEAKETLACIIMSARCLREKIGVKGK